MYINRLLQHQPINPIQSGVRHGHSLEIGFISSDGNILRRFKGVKLRATGPPLESWKFQFPWDWCHASISRMVARAVASWRAKIWLKIWFFTWRSQVKLSFHCLPFRPTMPESQEFTSTVLILRIGSWKLLLKMFIHGCSFGLECQFEHNFGKSWLLRVQVWGIFS